MRRVSVRAPTGAGACYAAHVTHALRRGLIDRYVPARERRHVNRRLDDMVETLAETDTLQFRQLAGLWRGRPADGSHPPRMLREEQF